MRHAINDKRPTRTTMLRNEGLAEYLRVRNAARDKTAFEAERLLQNGWTGQKERDLTGDHKLADAMETVAAQQAEAEKNRKPYKQTQAPDEGELVTEDELADIPFGFALDE